MGKMIDMTDLQIGYWHVLYRDTECHNSRATYWICQCKCGIIKSVNGVDLRRGKTSSCMSCSLAKKNSEQLKRNNKDNKKSNGGYGPDYYESEIGKQYGRLTIISLSPEEVQSFHSPKKMRCRCICGNIVDIRIDNLHSGRSLSCGCMKSHGEERIYSILSENHINFIREYSFDDLIGVNGGKLRFDFAIFKDNQLIKLIEFQGRLHYELTKLWNNDNKIHDEYKRKYCKEHNIELMEIKYSDINKINLQYLGLDNLLTDRPATAEDTR